MEKLEKKLVAGYDIQKNKVQLSFYIEDREDAESVSPLASQIDYEIPCLVAKTEQGWVVGEEALTAQFEQTGIVVDQLILRVLHQEMEVLDGYSAEELLEIFLRETLLFIPGVEMIGREVDAVAISLWEQNGLLLDVLFRCLMRLGIKENCIFAMSEQESAACYALSRPKELWKQDVLFFDFSQEHFIMKKLHRNQKAEKIILEIEEIDYSELFPISLLESEEGRQQADQSFLELLMQQIVRPPVSCVYLIGEGFCQKENWAVRTFKYLCSRKRVFLGMNLYTKGASLSAFDHITGRLMDSVTMRMKGCISVSIGICVFYREEKKLLNLVKEGKYWYHAKAQIEGILDEITELSFVITRQGVLGKLEYRLPLSEFPYREPRMTRVEVSLSFLSEEEAILQATDLGFGQYAESSGTVIQKKLKVEELLSGIVEKEEPEATGRFLLCGSKRSRYPFEIEESRQALYSIDELCYFLYHNNYLLEETFFSQKLMDFIRNNLEMNLLADKLEYAKKKKAPLGELITIVMESTGYYRGVEWKRMKEKLAYFGTQSREERLKLLGDMYLTERQYVQARNQYQLLLKLEAASGESREFFGMVYHNIGVLYMELFYFEEASEFLKQAYEYMPQDEILKKLLLTLQMAGMEVDYTEWKKKTKKEQVVQWEREWQKQEEEAIQDDRNYLAAEALSCRRQGKLGQFEEYAKKQLQEWMEEYRYEMEG